MTRTLTFLATIEPDCGTLLLQLALALRERGLTPDSLTIVRLEGRGEVQVSLSVAAEHERGLTALAERCDEIPGVHTIVVHASTTPS